MISLTSTKTQVRSNKLEIKSVAEVVTERLQLYDKRPVIRIDNGKNYDNVFCDDYLQNIYRMISFLNEKGDINKQKVISTFVKNRPEWDMTAFATLYTANILFPLDTKMNDEELKNILTVNPPDFMLVAKANLLRIRTIIAELKLSPLLLVCDMYKVYEDVENTESANISILNNNEILVSKALEIYEKKLLFKPSTRLEDENTVLCNYATSGTVTLPKVVELTHKNILFQVNEAMDIINIRFNEDFLNLGPYTHIATLLEFIVAKIKGFTVVYFTREADEDEVLENEIKKLKNQGIRIRGLMAVPKFWIYLLKEVLEEMKNKPILHNLYKHLVSIEKSNNFYDIGVLDKAKLISIRTYLKNKLGGYFAYGISSSTKIDSATIDIFGKLGITIIDIYGATEVCGVIAKNSLNESKKESCGKLIAGLEAKLGNIENIPGIPYPCGELYVKGKGVAMGYKGENKLLTDENGFYNTGDIAYIDKEQWIFIVGRKKELIHWPDGSYSDLMRLSNFLVRSIWLKDAMAIRLNENDDFLSVFVFPDYKRIYKDKRFMDLTKNGFEEIKVLRIFFEEAIDYAQILLGNRPILSKEKIFILRKKLERTPTHKIKFVSELKSINLEQYI